MCIRDRCKELQQNNKLQTENVVKQLYKQFTTEEISAKIAQLITPPELDIPVDVIFQSIEDLHKSCPVSYTHLRAHETVLDLVCRLLLEKKKEHKYKLNTNT